MKKDDVAKAFSKTKDKAKNVASKVVSSVVDTAEKTKEKVAKVTNKAVDDIKAKKDEKVNEYMSSTLDARSTLNDTFAMD